ncbi:MAG: Gfo/Idh/MocA family oxidoreductase [Sporichthyaceae bacterium]|nr:Gfo/Idh/MocA family oxidoreductase [Sporichthyaceae bacterium]
MVVRVGVIGVGMIGEDHVRRLSRVLSGSEVVAVTDVDPARAQEVVGRAPGARLHTSGEDLIGDDDVDGVVVASWGPTHEQFVLACIGAGKPVFCEKPLATSRRSCERIIDAEVAGGRRLVQVGYMRRYDAAYRALKATVVSGSIGAPLMVHCAHRNPSVPPMFTGEMLISDSAVHEMDLSRWLLDEEIVAVRVLEPRRNSRAPERLRDPLLFLFETSGGVLVDVELSANIGYGYDIRCEVVGESGTVSLGDEGELRVVREGVRATRVPRDWRDRFLRAYDVELQAWLDAVAAGGCTGPSAWDGYATAAVADACLEALGTGERCIVTLRERPDLYATAR